MNYLGRLAFIACVALVSLQSISALADDFDKTELFHEQIIVETTEIPYQESEETESPFDTLTHAYSPNETVENATSGGALPLGELVNGFADLLKRVLAPDTPLLKGSVIAEARPEGYSPMQLQNSRYLGKAFKKTFKSLLGFKLVEVEYKISYAYGADASGRGAFIPYVLFTPLKVVLDPLWHLQVDSLSLAPRNYGTVENPIAALEFNVAFKAKGITGTLMATDTFSLNAETGELLADWRDFQP
jgi:hypothetical protein